MISWAEKRLGTCSFGEMWYLPYLCGWTPFQDGILKGWDFEGVRVRVAVDGGNEALGKGWVVEEWLLCTSEFGE